MRIGRNIAAIAAVLVVLAACGDDTQEAPDEAPDPEATDEAEAPEASDEASDQDAAEEHADEVQEQLEELEEQDTEQALSAAEGDRDIDFTPREPGAGFPEDALAVGDTATVGEFEFSVEAAIRGDLAVDKHLEVGPPLRDDDRPADGHEWIQVLFHYSHPEGESIDEVIYIGLVDGDDNLYDRSDDRDSCGFGPQHVEESDGDGAHRTYRCFSIPEEQVVDGELTVFVETQATADETAWFEVPAFTDERIVTTDEG